MQLGSGGLITLLGIDESKWQGEMTPHRSAGLPNEMKREELCY
jgi:hypothetical protein